MRLVTLTLKNYRRFKEVFIEFPDGVIGIVGLNGAGKSTLVEAIAWAFYGSIAARTDKEGIRRTGAPLGSAVEVTLEFELGGTAFKLLRTLRGTGQSGEARLWGGGKLIADSVRAVDEEVVKLLSMEYQPFYTSFYAKQKELNALTDLQPAQRKEVIIRLLQIDSIDQTIDFVRSQTREAKMKAEVLKQSLKLKDENVLERDRVAKQLAAKDLAQKLKQAEADCKRAEGEVASFKDKFTEERRVYEIYNRLDKERSKLEAELNTKQKRLTDIAADIKAIPLLEKAITALTPKIAEHEKKSKLVDPEKKKNIEKLSQVEQDIGKWDTMVRTLRQKYAEIKQAKTDISQLKTCPTCRRPIDSKSDKTEIVKHFDAELGKIQSEGEKAKKKLGLLKTEKKALEATIGEYELNAAKRNAAAQKEYGEYQRLKSQLEQLNKLEAESSRIGQELAISGQKLAVVKAEQAKVPYDEKKHEEITKLYDTARESLESFFKVRNETKLALISTEKELELLAEEISKTITERQSIENLLKVQETKNRLVELLTEYREHWMSRIQPQLSKIAGSLFTRLTGSKYGGIELNDDYEIEIYENGQKFSIQRFSGGEADLANLCLRLAISELISANSGMESGFIILDEIFGSQDPQRKAAIMESLAELAKQFRQIFVISHVEDVKDSLENVIEVSENEEQLSRVEINR